MDGGFDESRGPGPGPAGSGTSRQAKTFDGDDRDRDGCGDNGDVVVGRGRHLTSCAPTHGDADRDLLDRLPLLLRLTARFTPFLLRGQVSLYRLNLATVE